MNIQYAFLLTIFASLSTIIGSLFIFLSKNTKKLVRWSLIIATLVMSYISIFDLLPNAYSLLNSLYYMIPSSLIMLISVNVGFIISFIFESKSVGEGSLQKLGILTFLCLSLHNLLEGIITFVTISYNLELGLKLFVGIFLHNIPEGIILSSLIMGSKNNRRSALFYSFLSGIQEFLGALISYLFLLQFMNKITMGILYSIVAGIMLYLAYKSLVEYIKERKPR